MLLERDRTSKQAGTGLLGDSHAASGRDRLPMERPVRKATTESAPAVTSGIRRSIGGFVAYMFSWYRY